MKTPFSSSKTNIYQLISEKDFSLLLLTYQTECLSRALRILEMFRTPLKDIFFNIMLLKSLVS